MSSASLAGIAGMIGATVGAFVMGVAAKWYINALEQRFASVRRASGLLAYENGVAMGLAITRQDSRHPLGHRVEHWSLPDERSAIAQLTSVDTYPNEDQ